MKSQLNIQETDNGTFIIYHDSAVYGFATYWEVEQFLSKVFVNANTPAIPSYNQGTTAPQPTSLPTGYGTWTFPKTTQTQPTASVPVKW